MSGVLVWLGVAALGGVGALARVGVHTAATRRFGAAWPLGTFAVNITGSFLLGLVAGLALRGDARLLLGGALLGSYTTFSTWMVETHALAEARRPGAAWLNVVLSLAVGLGAVALGRAIV